MKSKLLKKPLLPSKAKAAAEEEDPSIKVHEAVLEYLSSKLSTGNRTHSHSTFLCIILCTATEQLFVESATKLVRKYGTQPLFDVLRQQDTQFHHSKSICRVLSVVSKNSNHPYHISSSHSYHDIFIIFISITSYQVIHITTFMSYSYQLHHITSFTSYDSQRITAIRW